MTTYLIVSETWFNGMIHGGAMLMGPRGILAIDEGHCPKWAKTIFDSGEIIAEDPSDDEVKEIVQMIDEGHAKVLSNVAHMHVSSKVTSTLIGETDSEEQ